MKNFILFCLLIALPSYLLKAQFCVDTLYITYIPYELKTRVPFSLQQINNMDCTDTLTQDNLAVVINCYQKAISDGNKKPISSDSVSYNMVLKFHSNGVELFRTYYISGKELYYGGYRYEDDGGLLRTILSFIKPNNLLMKLSRGEK